MKFSDADILAAINDPNYRNGQPGQPIGYPVAINGTSIHAGNPFVAACPARNVVLEIREINCVANGAAHIQYVFGRNKALTALVALGGSFDPDVLFSRMQDPNPGYNARSRAIVGGDLTTPIVTGGVKLYYGQTFAASTPGPLRFDPAAVLLGGADDLPILYAVNLNSPDLEVSFLGREWPYDTDNY